MQKFIVPQFIDIESKIMGPITIRQFATIAIGGVMMFISYRLADFTLFLFLAVVTLLLIVLIGFIKFNGLPFHFFLLNVIGTYKKPMLRVWLKREITPKKKAFKKRQRQR